MFGFLKRGKKDDKQVDKDSQQEGDKAREKEAPEEAAGEDEAGRQKSEAEAAEAAEAAEDSAPPPAAAALESDETPATAAPEALRPGPSVAPAQESIPAREPAPTQDSRPAQESIPAQEPAPGPEVPAPAEPEGVEPVPEKTGFFGRLRSGLSRTRANLAEGLGNLLLGKKAIDEDLLEDIETQLLTADVGLEATDAILEELRQRVKRNQLADSEALYEALKQVLTDLLAPCAQPLQIPARTDKPFVVLVVGVNGVGKTTTIGKLARRFQDEGREVMLAAGDTFRAAAVEQLQEWGKRNEVPVIAQHTGADSASVIFDAYQAATARGVDVLLADTAGRLHNKSNLMQELEKVLRVLKKLDPALPQEILLVLDATTGQNALAQASAFTEALKLSGLVITKLDGTAKGGMIFAIAKQLALPIRFIGIGEKAADLRRFDAAQFVDALFSLEDGARQ